MPRLDEALLSAHRPASPDAAAAARRRLSYDELLLLQLGVMMKRWHLRETLIAPAMPLNPELEQRIKAGSPKRMEWFCGFILLVSLAWIYIQCVELVARIAQRD